MLPILFSLGHVPISSFGLMLIIAFMASVFVAWRLSKAYDLNLTKIFDLSVFSLLGGLIISRIIFYLANNYIFDSFYQIILINRYPGFSFWGGFWGGAIIFYIFSKRFKLNYWQVADIASVALPLGFALGNLGCFLGGSNVGIVSNLFFATPVVGLIGNRLPIALFESLIFLIIFYFLWHEEIKFHFQGKITILFLIFLGIDKLITDPFKFYRPLTSIGTLSYDQIQSLVLITIGIYLYYKLGKRSLRADLANLRVLATNNKKRELLLLTISKSCYNTKIAWQIKFKNFYQLLQNLPGKLRKKLNVRPTPGKYQ